MLNIAMLNVVATDHVLDGIHNLLGSNHKKYIFDNFAQLYL